MKNMYTRYLPKKMRATIGVAIWLNIYLDDRAFHNPISSECLFVSYDAFFLLSYYVRNGNVYRVDLSQLSLNQF